MKELKKIAKLLKKYNGDIDKLKNHGFERLRPRTYYNGYLMINRKLGIIAKRPYLYHHKKPKNDIIPTVVFKHNKIKLLYNADGEKLPKKIHIQPIAKRTRLIKAIEILTKKYGNYSCLYDLREDNVGWYKGKPVMFDW